MNVDRILHYSLGAMAVFVGLILFVIIVFIGLQSIGLISEIGLSSFLLETSWNPYEKSYGIILMLFTSLFLMLGAVIIALPLAILMAIFFNFYIPSSLSVVGRRFIEVIAGIPSVVYGLWVLTLLVPIIAQWKQPGTSLLAGIIVLTIMIFPTMTIILDSALKKIPSHYRESAEALAIKRRCFSFFIALPVIGSSLSTAITLGGARAIGETMAVMMVTGNIVQLEADIFKPVRALTSNIALEMAYALDNHRSALYVSCFMLMLFVIGLVMINQRLSRAASYAQ